MAKYKITLQPRNLSRPEIVNNIIALDATNAKGIATIYNDNCFVVSCVRQGVGTSTTVRLIDIKNQMVSAMNNGDDVEAQRQEKAFYLTVAKLKQSMDVVAWGMTKNHIPYLPPSR